MSRIRKKGQVDQRSNNKGIKIDYFLTQNILDNMTMYIC